ncbi:uncharacterized protein LY79DRAFT_671217 [Colletotrichum navitas]|uniref:Uncharacterized protein n=1 Tax=Colletotrichum navitas TaxID=681940 RepID=A0AAD8PWH7_9PEZI|nr:uncharacterized protein LY79DRAFT_671217 [Colletotrichum navitas]KAK1585284.1 hypothetical protein LY79DRAFT_671217 [Colletotrichum navitas]
MALPSNFTPEMFLKFIPKSHNHFLLYEKTMFVASAANPLCHVPKAQALVTLCKELVMTVWPVSLGRNPATAELPRAFPAPWLWIWATTNRKFEVNVGDPYALLKPGASFQDLHEHMEKHTLRGHPWLSTPVGQGSVFGNTIERGVLDMERWQLIGAVCRPKLVRDVLFHVIKRELLSVPGSRFFLPEYRARDNLLRARGLLMQGIPTVEELRHLNHGFAYLGAFPVGMQELPHKLAKETTSHGWGQFRAHMAPMDPVADTFSWNDNAQDLNGIVAPGRNVYTMYSTDRTAGQLNASTRSRP